MKKLTQSFVYSMIFIFNLVWLAAPAQAALIGAEEVVAAQSRQDAEQKISTALARDDVSSTLEKLGVGEDEVRDRVAALSDEEINTLSDRIDRLPAGGDFFGTVGLIFIILLITDLLGLTKVFPFTRAQR